jgi:uncharacterized repeat protein (TIGR01451 family)
VSAGVTQISNTATIADDGTNGTDPTPGNNTGSDTTPLAGAQDLSITKSDGGASVAPGGTVAYTLTYANTGTIGAAGVTLTETVPASTTFNAGASTAGWVCTPNNNAGSTCTLAIGTLAAGGGSQTATFAVTVVNPVSAGVSQISNTASIADDGTSGIDPTPGNNSGSDTTPLTGAPDLSITKSDGGASVAPGATVAYTLTYANAGNRGATGVVLTETVPANTSFNSGASTAGWACAPNNNAGSICTLAIGSVPAGGGSQTATFAVTVVTPVTAGITQVSNTASIADDGTNGTDPTPANNSGSDTTPLTGGPDFSLTVSDGGSSTTLGATVVYTLTYSNAGNRGASGVVLTATVPANSVFNSGSSSAGWSCTPNNNAGSACTLTIGALPAGGGPNTKTFAVTVNNSVPGGTTQISDTATITDDGANGTDPTPANNSGSDNTPLIAGSTISGTKTVAGSFVAGGTVTYTVTLTNSGAGSQADNPGNELTDVLPSSLALVSATATSGTAVATTGTNTVTWNGSIPAAGSVTITITAQILPAAAGSTVSNQGTISFDGDGNGTNESTALTDDPSVAGAANPTSFSVPATAAIPALSLLGMFLMLGLLAGTALLAMRR